MENLTASGVVGKVFHDVRPLFYLELPSTSSFQRLVDVPDYLKQVFPYFFIMIFIEAGIRWFQGLPKVRFNDSINSLSAGLILVLTKLLFSSIDISLYMWFHAHFCVWELPWDSPLTWLVAFLGVDCGYYWFHRFAHEVNLFWASHQAHHSSEEYTLSTALRQSFSQRFTSMFVYLPLGLVLPAPAYFAHKQLNLLYQFWIHTEVIDRLGPLEWVLNTPSHHRVHHGRNPYCIDCNYAGVLIIWDRMFGTFQPELREEKVVYGLVHPLSSWDPVWAQLHHYIYILKTLWTTKEGWKFRLQFLFKGPGWSPGKPRLGLREDIPQVSPEEKPYDRTVPLWVNVYIAVHFATFIVYSLRLTDNRMYLPSVVILVVVLYFIYSVMCLGMILDHHRHCVLLEVARLTLLLVGPTLYPVPQVFSNMMVLRVLVAISLGLWSHRIISSYSPKTSKTE